jgi:hypothetical protein
MNHKVIPFAVSPGNGKPVCSFKKHCACTGEIYIPLTNRYEGRGIMQWFGERSLGWVFVTRMIGILTFLIIVVLANILRSIYPTCGSAVVFLNNNFWLLLLIGIILLIADLFTAFPFPLDLPAPVIRAIGSVFVIAFILRVFEWVDQITGSDLFQFFWFISFIVIPMVFLLVLVTGYYEIIRRLFRSGRTNGEITAISDPTIGTPRMVHSENGNKSWEEVGIEFRMMVYDIIHRFREEIRGDRR